MFRCVFSKKLSMLLSRGNKNRPMLMISCLPVKPCTVILYDEFFEKPQICYFHEERRKKANKILIVYQLCPPPPNPTHILCTNYSSPEIVLPLFCFVLFYCRLFLKIKCPFLLCTLLLKKFSCSNGEIVL